MTQPLEDDFMYMDFARRAAERSKAERLQVGCVIVKNDSVVAYGWNGMPKGYDNKCEHSVLTGHSVGANYIMHLGLRTNPEVSHAEMNAIGKLTESTVSSSGATLYCTHAPCLECAKLIQRTGITSVVFGEYFRSNDGLALLAKRGIKTSLLVEPQIGYQHE